MEKIIGALSSNIDFIALALVILGGLFAKNYLSRWKWPTEYKTLIVGSLFMGVYVALKWHTADLSKLFFTYCVATSLYELILKYAFQWLASKGIKLPTGITTCLLLTGLLLPSCMTQRRAIRYFQAHGFAAASYCASAFPVKDSVIRVAGHTVVLPGDTVLIPGQTYPCPAAPAPQEVTCPASRLIRDTLLRTDTLTLWRENTAKTAAMRGELANLRADSTRAILVRAKATKRGWLMWGTWVALALLVAGWLFIRSKTALLTSVLRGRL